MNNTTKPITIIRQKNTKSNENNNNKCNFGDMHKIQTVRGLSTPRRGHRRRSKWYRALDSRGMVSYQWPIVNGFNRKNALGQCQKYPGQSQDPETGWAVSESGKRPWPISRLPKILKMPMGNLEIATNPENARNIIH